LILILHQNGLFQLFQLNNAVESAPENDCLSSRIDLFESSVVDAFTDRGRQGEYAGIAVRINLIF